MSFSLYVLDHVLWVILCQLLVSLFLVFSCPFYFFFLGGRLWASKNFLTQAFCLASWLSSSCGIFWRKRKTFQVLYVFKTSYPRRLSMGLLWTRYILHWYFTPCKFVEFTNRLDFDNCQLATINSSFLLIAQFRSISIVICPPGSFIIGLIPESFISMKAFNGDSIKIAFSISVHLLVYPRVDILCHGGEDIHFMDLPHSLLHLFYAFPRINTLSC